MLIQSKTGFIRPPTPSITPLKSREPKASLRPGYTSQDMCVVGTVWFLFPIYGTLNVWARLWRQSQSIQFQQSRT